MNKADLVNELAEKMGISQKQSRKFINTFQAILTERVKEDEIILQGFGTFKVWEQAERTAATLVPVFPVRYRPVGV